MNWMAKITDKRRSRLAGLVLVLFLLLGGGFAGSAQAAVTTAKAWAGVTGGTGTLTTLPATAYVVGSGSNRLLVAALAVEYSTTATLINPTITYGGKALTQLATTSAVNGATRGRMHIWVGYLKEADIAAASGNNLIASWANSGTMSTANLFAATYAGVSQTRPVPLNSGYAVNGDTAANTTALTFAKAISYADTGMVFYVAADSGTSTTVTQATGFTASLAPTNYGSRGTVVTAANKTTNTPAGTVAATTSVTMGGGTSGYTGIVAAALNPDTVTFEPAYLSIPSNQAVNGNPLKLVKMIGGVLPGNSDEIGYESDQATFVYRAVNSKSDGFTSTTLNSKWIKSHIGGFASAAPAVVDGALNLNGRGTINTTSTTESFTYLYQNNSTGSFTIDVRVDSILNTNTAAKAGIMVRTSTANNSMYAAVFVTPGSGAIFARRTSNGGSSTFTTTTGITPPRWLRLARNGNSFSAFQSADGNTWTAVGTAVTITMTDPILAGLAVSSQSTTLDTQARFDNYLYMPANTSGMNTTWTSTATNITANDGGALTDWTDGTYAISVRNGATGALVDTNLFNYSACVDGTPSTLTIAGGQTVKGNNVSLPALYTASGNVGTFTYKINGATVTSPWNSYSLVPAGTSQAVTFEVRGTDPDCGGKVITATNTVMVDNSCIDPTPSSVTIMTGQSTGGTIDLTKLYLKSGNVSSFTYKVNGVTVTSPWDSSAYGTTSPTMVTLEVRGTDPDCGGNTVVAANQVEIDNRCIQNPPSISFDEAKRYVGPGRAIPISVTIRNEDSLSCAPSTFDLAVIANTNLVDFNAPTITGGTGVVLGGRESRTVSMTASAKPAAVDWNENDITVQITSSYAGHNAPKTTGTVKTVVFLVSPITHNSVTTHSTRWGGKWGTSEAGSKYGNFDCMICHDKGGPNVKWMKGSITLPEGTVWGVGGSVTRAVVFNDAQAGSADWGSDDPDGLDIAPDTKTGPGRTGSNKVCEVCHSVTQHHRYDTELDPDGAGSLTKQTAYNHFPNRDCTDCHRHSLGFTADCTGCHGDPPLNSTFGGPNGLANIPAPTGSTTQGTHYKHTVVLGYPCEYCHAGWRNIGEMPKAVSTANGMKQQINHKFNVFYDHGITDPAKDAGHYTGQDGVNYEPYAPAIAAGNQLADGTIPPGKGTMTCENIYCHGGTVGGTNPKWNGNIACNSCHGVTAGNPPPGYSHNTHVAKNGIACSACHGSSPAPGVNGHVNGRVRWDVSPLPGRGGTPMYKGAVAGESNALGNEMPPSSSYGTCTNIACHYGRQTPVWNSGVPATCTICHNNGSNNGLLTSSAPNSGNHELHVNPPAATIHEKMVGSFINKCESCHGGGANIGTHVGHMDYTLTIGGGMTYDGGAGTCTSQCHNLKGIDFSNNPVTVTWGSGNALSCEACHEAPFIGPSVVVVASAAGSHLKANLGEALNASTNWGAQCKKCHPYHEGGVTVPEIPLNSTFGADLGFAFPVTGGMHLGGSATSGSTEAEICWNCHDNAANRITRTATMTITSAANNSSFVDTGNGLGNFKVGRYVKISGATAQANNGYFKVKTVNAGSLFVDATLTAQATGSTITITDEISEWGSNAPLSTSPIATWSAYDYGALYTDTATSPGTRTSNWTTGLWRSGRGLTSTDMFWYKRGRIQSTHSANFASGTSVVTGGIYAKTETRDNVGDIRCSYCHDVHDTNKAIDIATGEPETFSGRPYLRGSWYSNPYEEDGAPQSAKNYANTAPFGSVPRGNGANQTSLGGFNIDINNVRPGTAPTPAGTTAANGTAAANPTSGWTLNGSAGLCMTCHSTDKNGDAVTIDTMDWEIGESNWLGTNGHANAVLGGSGVGAANIFNLRGGTLSTTGATLAPAMHYYGGPTGSPAPGDVGNYGFRNGSNSGYAYTPSLSSVSENNEITTPNTNRWGTMTIDAATVNTSYHKFSCSKCHNPHASRLPKLMITNCLDTKHNTWDDPFQLNAATGINQNRSLSNWSSAQNCHRLGGIANGTGPEPVDTNAVGATHGTTTDYSNRGWNVVTPWTSGPPQ